MGGLYLGDLPEFLLEQLPGVCTWRVNLQGLPAEVTWEPYLERYLGAMGGLIWGLT